MPDTKIRHKDIRLPMASGPLQPDVEGNGLPVEPALRAVARDVASSMRCSFAMVSSETAIDAPGALDIAISDFLASRSERALAAYRKNARSVLDRPVAARELSLGRFGRIQPAEYARVGSDNISTLTATSSIDAQQLKTSLHRAQNAIRRIHVPSSAFDDLNGGDAPQKPKLQFDKDLIDGMAYRKLRLYLKEVSCFQTTSGPGSDEINLGGTVLTAAGTTSMVDQFVVSSDMDEDERVRYPGHKMPNLADPDFASKLNDAVMDAWLASGKVFAEWDVRTDLGWPTAYAATVAMAEKDDGGFWTFLKELVKRIIAEIEKAMGKTLGMTVGGAVGSLFGPGWGTVIGALVGFIIGAVLDEILGNNADDIVGVKPLTMSFGAATKSYYDWTGLLAKPRPTTFHMDFKGDGGHYRVGMYYELSKT